MSEKYIDIDKLLVRQFKEQLKFEKEQRERDEKEFGKNDKDVPRDKKFKGGLIKGFPRILKNKGIMYAKRRK